MNINAPNEDNLCFIKNVLEQGATLTDSAWLFFSFSQDRKLAPAHTHTHVHVHACCFLGEGQQTLSKVSVAVWF